MLLELLMLTLGRIFSSFFVGFAPDFILVWCIMELA